MEIYKTPYKYYRYLCEVLNIEHLSKRFVKCTTFNNNELLYYGGDQDDKYHKSIRFFRTIVYNNILDIYYKIASIIGYNNLSENMSDKESINCKIENKKYVNANISLLTVISILYMHNISQELILEKVISYIFKK